MANHITLEDINTWDYLFGNGYSVLEIPGDFSLGDETDLYKVTHTAGTSFGITLKVDPYKVWNESLNDYQAFLYYIGNDAVHIMRNRYQNGEILILTPQGYTTYLFLENNNFEIIDTYPSGVLPKYFRYYFFDSDTGENRRYLLDTPMGTGVLVNETEYIQKDGETKYLPLDMVVSDEKLSIDVNGQELGISFSDWKIPLYEPPLIEITDKFYIGCNNKISDVVSSPVTTTEYFINNKTEDYILIPEDTTKESQLVNVVTTSEYPYLPLDTYFEVSIEYYIVDDPSDFELKEYTVFDTQLRGITQELNDIKHTIDMNNNRFRDCNITVNYETIIKNTVLMDNIIINNAELTITNGEFANNKIINNGTLIIDNCNGNKFNIINNGELIIKDSNFQLQETSYDLPFIHNQGNILMQNNSISNASHYENTSIIFIRGLDNVNDLIKDNTWSYEECLYTEDTIAYQINGNGFIYSNIDDDTIILKELVISNV